MNYRTIAKASRYGSDHQTPIASGDLATGAVTAALLAAAPIPAADGSLTLQTGITPREMGYHPYHLTVLQMTNMPFTLADATAYSGLLIYTMPTGWINVLGASLKFTITCTSVLASTLNASSTLAMGVGTATAAAVTPATTAINIIPGTGVTAVAATSPATINTANTAVTAGKTLAGVPYDGTTTAMPVYFNIGVPTNTDIDADATLLINGTLQIAWVFGGNYGLTYAP